MRFNAFLHSVGYNYKWGIQYVMPRLLWELIILFSEQKAAIVLLI